QELGVDFDVGEGLLGEQVVAPAEGDDQPGSRLDGQPPGVGRVKGDGPRGLPAGVVLPGGEVAAGGQVGPAGAGRGRGQGGEQGRGERGGQAAGGGPGQGHGGNPRRWRAVRRVATDSNLRRSSGNAGAGGFLRPACR